MPATTHHVSPNPKGGWSVHRRGSQRATRHFATKKAAETFGRVVSFHQQTVLIIHHEDGSRTCHDGSTADRPKAPRRPSRGER